MYIIMTTRGSNQENILNRLYKQELCLMTMDSY